MKVEYKTISISELPKLNEYWKERWITSIVVNNFIVLYRELKKEKTKSLVVSEWSKTLWFLTACSENSQRAIEWAEENGIDINTLQEFSSYWLERSENWKKYRFELEKVFDIRRRLATWLKRNNTNNQKRWVTILE